MKTTGQIASETYERLSVDVFDTTEQRTDIAIIKAAIEEALEDQKRDLWEKISLSRIEADNWKGLYEKQLAKKYQI